MDRVDRARVARLFAIVVGAAGACTQPQPAAPQQPASAGSAAPGSGGPATAQPAGSADTQPKLTCWLVRDPRCADPKLPRVC